ncbi:Mif2 protein [Martiniozyma asiatica (nom. inval.)]|nr:Mif2 protein [Martiniozyma asiatica]
MDQRHSLPFHQPGKVGRKTGFRLSFTPSRDSNGLEPIDAFFSEDEYDVSDNGNDSVDKLKKRIGKINASEELNSNNNNNNNNNNNYNKNNNNNNNSDNNNSDNNNSDSDDEDVRFAGDLGPQIKVSVKELSGNMSAIGSKLTKNMALSKSKGKLFEGQKIINENVSDDIAIGGSTEQSEASTENELKDAPSDFPFAKSSRLSMVTTRKRNTLSPVTSKSVNLREPNDNTTLVDTDKAANTEIGSIEKSNSDHINEAQVVTVENQNINNIEAAQPESKPANDDTLENQNSVNKENKETTNEREDVDNAREKNIKIQSSKQPPVLQETDSSLEEQVEQPSSKNNSINVGNETSHERLFVESDSSDSSNDKSFVTNAAPSEISVQSNTNASKETRESNSELLKTNQKFPIVGGLIESDEDYKDADVSRTRLTPSRLQKISDSSKIKTKPKETKTSSKNLKLLRLLPLAGTGKNINDTVTASFSSVPKKSIQKSTTKKTSTKKSLTTEQPTRRSTRHRVPPVASWKNEKVVYETQKINGVYVKTVKDVEQTVVTPEPIITASSTQKAKKIQKTKKSLTPTPSSKKVKNKQTVIDSVEIHSEDENSKIEVETVQPLDSENEQEIISQKLASTKVKRKEPPLTVDAIHITKKRKTKSNKKDSNKEEKSVQLPPGADWQNDASISIPVFEGPGAGTQVERIVAWAPNKYKNLTIISTEEENFRIGTLFDEDSEFCGAGIIEIPAGQKKAVKANNDTYFIFHVIDGLLDITLNRSSFTVSKGCTFEIPMGNYYQFVNNSTEIVKLLFIQAKYVVIGESDGELEE